MKNNLKILKAMSNETRLKLLYFLSDGEKCVCKILPKIRRSQPTVSGQLKKMENLGLLSSRRNGKHILYKISSAKIKKMLRCLKSDYKE